MARKRTFYGSLLALVTLYVIYKYLVPSGIMDVTPPLYISRMANVSAPTDHRRTTTITATTSMDSGSTCQLERLVFISHKELSEFTVSYSSKNVPPSKLNSTERGSLFDLLDIVQVFLDRHKISYVLGYHSLLGSYMMHGILPYDDTIELLARVSHKQTLSKAIATDDKLKTKEHTSINSNYTHVRFFLKTSGQKPSHWPFVELHFYDENSTHVWTTMPPPKRVVMKIDSFYPFHERPFAGHWLDAPEDPLQFLLQIYSKSHYETFGWDYRADVAEPPTKMGWVAMRKHHPFVGRINCAEGVKETLKFSGVAQYDVYIDEHFPTKTFTVGFE